MTTHDLDTTNQPMTLIERLISPAYVANPVGGDALLDTASTLATMAEAAKTIRTMEKVVAILERALRDLSDLSPSLCTSAHPLNSTMIYDIGQ